MSALAYSNYPGVGQWAHDNLGYSQAVRIGDRIECSGQGKPTRHTIFFYLNLFFYLFTYSCPGGWNPNLNYPQFPTDISEEIAQAFKNVDINLRHAGGKGWSQVFRVNTYHTNLTQEVTVEMTKNFGKWMPEHKPIWTQIGVKQLGAPEMNVEIEVVAYDAKA